MIFTKFGTLLTSLSILIRFSNIIIVLCTTDYSNVLDLSFSHKKYEKIPEDAFNKTQLEVLDASNNEIKEIPPEIGKLVNLKELDASNNKIKEIPGSIENLKETLQILDLSKNPLDRKGNGKTGKDRTLGKKELKKIFGDKVIFRREHFRKKFSDCKDVLAKILYISGYVLVGICLIPCPS